MAVAVAVAVARAVAVPEGMGLACDDGGGGGGGKSGVSGGEDLCGDCGGGPDCDKRRAAYKTCAKQGSVSGE